MCDICDALGQSVCEVCGTINDVSSYFAYGADWPDCSGCGLPVGTAALPSADE